MRKLALAGFISILSMATAFAADPVKVGDPLPELKLKYDGDAPDVAGKPVMVEFWATWCPPCRTSIPHLNEIYKKFKDKGLVILGVTNEEKSVVKKFTKQIPIDYTVAYADGLKGEKMYEQFQVEGIPHAVLADKSGKVIWMGHPMTLTDKIIEKAVE